MSAFFLLYFYKNSSIIQFAIVFIKFLYFRKREVYVSIIFGGMADPEW